MHVENFYGTFIYPYEMLEFMQIKVYGTWFYYWIDEISFLISEFC